MTFLLSPERRKRTIQTGRHQPSRPSTAISASRSVNLTGRIKNLKIVNEKHELKAIRSAYNNFVKLFTTFHAKNGPAITGQELSAAFLSFQEVFDVFLIQCNQFYNSSTKTRRIGRYSPIIEYSTQLLREWTRIVSIMNELPEITVLPHIKRIKSDYSSISKNIAKMSKSAANSTFYRDGLIAAVEKLKHEISQASYNTEKIFKNLNPENLSVDDLEKMKEDAMIISQRVNEDYVGLFPSSIKSTPENTRIRGYLKTACGEIISLVDAGFFFKDDVKNILNYMKRLDNTIRDLLDNLGIVYKIDVSPNGEDIPDEVPVPKEEPKEEEKPKEMFYVQVPTAKKPMKRSFKKANKVIAPQVTNRTKSIKEQPKVSQNDKIEHFINEMSQTLGISLKGNNEEKMELIEKTIKERLGEKKEQKSTLFPTPNVSYDDLNQINSSSSN